MVDPQKPNPNAPWCPKCEGHTFYIIKHSYGKKGGGYEICRNCDTRMILSDVYSSARPFIYGCGGFFILIIILSVIGINLASEERVSVFYLTLGASIAFGGMTFVSVWWNKTREAKWKKWAKERGWEKE